MIRNIDYDRMTRIANYVLSLSESELLVLNELIDTDEIIKSIQLLDQVVVISIDKQVLLDQGFLRDIISDDDSRGVLIDVFAFLFAVQHKHLFESCGTFNEVRRGKPIIEMVPLLVSNYIDFALYALCLIRAKGNWQAYIQGFDARNWYEINCLGEILPLAQTELSDVLHWARSIVSLNSKDGALPRLALYICQWVNRSPDNVIALEHEIGNLLEDSLLSNFVPQFTKCLQKAQGHSYGYYAERFIKLQNSKNAYLISYTLGGLDLSAENSSSSYFTYLLGRYSEGALAAHEVILICADNEIIDPAVTAIIEEKLLQTEDKMLLLSVINFVWSFLEKGLSDNWIRSTASLLVCKPNLDIIPRLEGLLIELIEKDLILVYDLLELRFKAMADSGILSNVFLEISRVNKVLFQQKLIFWFIQEDQYIHNGIRGLCSLNELDKSVFNIPALLFQDLSKNDRLYMAYKIVGYVYSMEPLQRLFLSVILSISEKDERLHAELEFLLSEYIAYNYRSTLELLRKKLSSKDDIGSFSTELFAAVVSKFEDYFSKLQQVKMPKELMPYERNQLFKRFYQKKQFENIRPLKEKDNFLDIFKRVVIDSNKWAIRRPGDLKHKPQELGHYSYSMEYPSGEKLNPIRQEFLRKSYQKMTKDEINIE